MLKFLSKKGFCPICKDSEEEELVELLGIEVCEGCYHDLINLFGYHNVKDMLECDQQMLMRFLNKLNEKLKK